jgi:hypothetical protein
MGFGLHIDDLHTSSLHERNDWRRYEPELAVPYYRNPHWISNAPLFVIPPVLHYAKPHEITTVLETAPLTLDEVVHH